MEKMKKQTVGSVGEEIAAKYLTGKGYKVLFRNYRQKFGEIDIIARSPDCEIIFIEVKTLLMNLMKFSNCRIPEDNFTTQKRRTVNRMCEFFAARYPQLINEEVGWRIDLVAVEIFEDGSPSIIRHYENI
jgi:putative endonuclease